MSIKDTNRVALDQEMEGEDWSDQFEDLFPQLWEELKDGLEELCSELRKKCNDPDPDLRELTDAAIEDCRNHTGSPSIEEIQKRIIAQRSPKSVYEAYQHEIRTQLSGKFLRLDKGLKQSLEKTKSQVANVLIEKGRLGGLTEAQGSEFIQAIAKRIPQKLEKLKDGFQILADFDLSYRGLIQHRIWQHLDEVVHPSDQISISEKPSAEEIRAVLQTLHKKAVAKCQTTLQELNCEPSQAAYAIVEEFLDNVLRQQGIETEWRKFIKQVRSQVWPDVFAKFEQNNLL